MDVEKIKVRQYLERMAINYFLMGKISEEQANKIADYVGSVIGKDHFPESDPEKKIVYFPGTWQKGKPQEPPKAPEQRKLSFSEHSEGFKGVQFGSYYHTRIMWALYNLHIHSLEELAKTPPGKLLRNRGIGKKSLACIRSIVEGQGFTLGKEWSLTEPTPDVLHQLEK